MFTDSFLALLVAATLPTAALTAPRSPYGAGRAQDPLVIGVVLPLIGEQAKFGENAARGIRLAVDEENQAGGVAGRRVALRTLDSEGKPEVAAIRMQELARDPRVGIVLGEIASSRTLAMAPLAEAAGLAVVTPTATNPLITRGRDGALHEWVFRACIADPVQGDAMARFARETLGVRRAAMLVDPGNDFSRGLAARFEARFRAAGGTIVTTVRYTGDGSLALPVEALIAAGVDVAYMPGWSRDVAQAARELSDRDARIMLLGSDAWATQKLLASAGDALEGAYFTDHVSEAAPTPAMARFVGRYRAAYGVDPDTIAVHAYDAARLAIAAMRRAPALDRTRFRDALASTVRFEGVAGPITIDAGHDGVKPVMIRRIVDGAFRYAATVPLEAGDAAAR